MLKTQIFRNDSGFASVVLLVLILAVIALSLPIFMTLSGQANAANERKRLDITLGKVTRAVEIVLSRQSVCQQVFSGLNQLQQPVDISNRIPLYVEDMFVALTNTSPGERIAVRINYIPSDVPNQGRLQFDLQRIPSFSPPQTLRQGSLDIKVDANGACITG